MASHFATIFPPTADFIILTLTDTIIQNLPTQRFLEVQTTKGDFPRNIRDLENFPRKQSHDGKFGLEMSHF